MTSTEPSATTSSAITSDALSQERVDLLETLATHRQFLRHTVAGLTDEQARLTPTVSALSLGGLIKHVAATEESWVEFIERGPESMGGPGPDGEPTPEQLAEHTASFTLLPTETLAGVLADLDRVAARTDALVAALPDLDAAHPLPPAPWFTPGATRSARRCLQHIIAETAQHAGHADILRETIDGQRTMGG